VPMISETVSTPYLRCPIVFRVVTPPGPSRPGAAQRKAKHLEAPEGYYPPEFIRWKLDIAR
jgi:hypothetical protein